MIQDQIFEETKDPTQIRGIMMMVMMMIMMMVMMVLVMIEMVMLMLRYHLTCLRLMVETPALIDRLSPEKAVH